MAFLCAMRAIKPYIDRRGARECDSRTRVALGVAIRGGNSLDSHRGSERRRGVWRAPGKCVKHALPDKRRWIKCKGEGVRFKEKAVELCGGEESGEGHAASCFWSLFLADGLG